MIGTTIGSYQVLARVGAGGMGEVFRAHDGRLNRDVAIKVLPPEAIANPERRQRFEREAEVLASLSHTNIAHVYGLEGVGESTAIVMEFVDGPTLDERIARGPLPIDEALSTAAQACEGLEAAHERGIVHRDLKPANIKLRTDGVVKILDFGLARALTGDGNADVANSPTMLTAATEAGVVLGTAADMSPEQARGQSVDRRADIWAFGCVLYEMLTSAQAFGGRGRPTFWWASFSRSRSGRDCRPPCRRESGNCCTAVCGKTRRIACAISPTRATRSSGRWEAPTAPLLPRAPPRQSSRLPLGATGRCWRVLPRVRWPRLRRCRSPGA